MKFCNLIVLFSTACSSSAFSGADPPEPDAGSGGSSGIGGSSEVTGGTGGGSAGAAGAAGVSSGGMDGGAVGATSDAGAAGSPSADAGDAKPSCSCTHLPFVPTGDPCGPGEIQAPTCDSVGQVVCFRCEHECSGLTDPLFDSGGACTPVVGRGTLPSSLETSYWCCPWGAS